MYQTPPGCARGTRDLGQVGVWGLRWGRGATAATPSRSLLVSLELFPVHPEPFPIPPASHHEPFPVPPRLSPACPGPRKPSPVPSGVPPPRPAPVPFGPLPVLLSHSRSISGPSQALPGPSQGFRTTRSPPSPSRGRTRGLLPQVYCRSGQGLENRSMPAGPPLGLGGASGRGDAQRREKSPPAGEGVRGTRDLAALGGPAPPRPPRSPWQLLHWQLWMTGSTTGSARPPGQGSCRTRTGLAGSRR